MATFKSDHIIAIEATIFIANIGDVKITLTGDAADAKTNTPAGSKKDLVVNVYGAKYIGKYTYGSKDDDSEADYTFKIRLMSPLLEGKIAAIKDAVEVPATSVDGFNIDGSMISGYTYNNIAYSIFADKYVDATSVNWKHPEVKNVKFKTYGKCRYDNHFNRCLGLYLNSKS